MHSPGSLLPLTPHNTVAYCDGHCLGQALSTVGDNARSHLYHWTVSNPIDRRFSVNSIWSHLPTKKKKRKPYTVACFIISLVITDMHMHACSVCRFGAPFDAHLLLTWAYFINMWSRGIRTLSSWRKPLSTGNEPNFGPISPTLMPDRKITVLKNMHTLSNGTRHEQNYNSENDNCRWSCADTGSPRECPTMAWHKRAFSFPCGVCHDIIGLLGVANLYNEWHYMVHGLSTNIWNSIVENARIVVQLEMGSDGQ